MGFMFLVLYMLCAYAGVVHLAEIMKPVYRLMELPKICLLVHYAQLAGFTGG